jgi:hypothetical protein
MTATTVAPAIRNSEQYRVLAAYGRGEDLAAIAAGMELRHDYVHTMLHTLAGMDRGRARELASTYDRQRTNVAAARTPKPAAPVVTLKSAQPMVDKATQEVPVGAVGAIEVLLVRAETSNISRAVTLAARIRSHIADLGTLLEQEAARARVAALATQLEQAKAALRQLQPARPAPAPRPASAPAEDPLPAVVRAWCRENDVPCSITGRVNRSAVDAYLEAHK